jgi:hypothetical protein
MISDPDFRIGAASSAASSSSAAASLDAPFGDELSSLAQDARLHLRRQQVGCHGVEQRELDLRSANVRVRPEA